MDDVRDLFLPKLEEAQQLYDELRRSHGLDSQPLAAPGHL